MAKCNGDDVASRRVVPGEIEIARPKNAIIFTRFYAGRCLKFQRRPVVYRGRRYHPEPRASSTPAAPSRRHFYGRAGIRVRRVERYTFFSLFLFLSLSFSHGEPRRRTVCRTLMRFSARGTPSWGPARIAYINPSSTCLPHVARQFAVFRGVK